MEWSNKPCLGCGQPGHPTNAVGMSGEELLQAGRKRQAEYPQRLAHYRAYRLLKNANRSPHLGLPWEHDKLLCYALGAALTARADRPEFVGVQFPRPDDYREQILVRDDMRGAGSEETRDVPLLPEQAAAVRALVPAIKKGIETAYNVGLTQGQDLLRQLASGDITAARFEEQVRPRSE